MAVASTSSMGDYGERHAEILFTTDRRVYSTQVQLGEPMTLLGLLIGARVTQRQHWEVHCLSYITTIGISGNRRPCDDLVSLVPLSMREYWAGSHEGLMLVIIAAQLQVYSGHVQPRGNGYTISSMNSKLVFIHNLFPLCIL